MGFVVIVLGIQVVMDWVEPFFVEDLFDANPTLGTAMLVGLLAGVFLLTNFILTIVWFYRAYSYIQTRGATGRTWSTGWAVGAWFIPMANVIIPKLILNEIDRVSHPDLEDPVGDAWRDQPRTPIADWWWVTVWLGYGVGSLTWIPPVAETQFAAIIFGSWGLYCIALVLEGVTILKLGSRLTRP